MSLCGQLHNRRAFGRRGSSLETLANSFAFEHVLGALASAFAILALAFAFVSPFTFALAK